MEDKSSPTYQYIDGFAMLSALSPEAFRSAINYNHKPGQLFLCTFPKSGSTWLQHIIMLIVRKGEPIKDEADYLLNTPTLEFAGTEAIDLMNGPGVIKTHLPFNMIRTSPQAKYIYIARNPKDVCVSFYYHTKKFYFYNFQNGKFDDFFDIFINGKNDFGPYFDNVLSWYQHRNDPNVHFVTFENLKKDTKGEILKLSRFIGEEYYNAITNDSKYLENVLYYSSFEYMKGKLNDDMDRLAKWEAHPPENIAVTPGLKYFFEHKQKHAPKEDTSDIKFVRKGIVGDWKSHFTPEQNEKMEEWIKKRTEGSDIMNLWKDTSV